MKKIFKVFTSLVFAISVVTYANAETKIQEVKGGGITAWLVESHSIPMVSSQIAFRAGSAFEPLDKNGVAHMTAALMNEGAGSYDATSYKEALKRIGSQVGIGAGKLNLEASSQSLTENVDETFRMLALALKNPRFTDEDFSRVQEATLSGLKAEKENPGAVAKRLFTKSLYNGHPYGRLTIGSTKSITDLSVWDVQEYYKENINKTNMVMSVVGDITAKQLKTLLDKHFSNLPEGEKRNKMTVEPKDAGLVLSKYHMDIPQSNILMGHKGINRHDPDYYTAYFLNYILGGGGFNSRLMEEIREKRGLTYGVYSYFEPLPMSGSFTVSVQTKNKDADKVVKLVQKEMKKIQKGVSDKEYQGAMDYLVGSFPLRLDSNSKILGYLSVMQMENLGKDYLDNWTERMKKITKDDLVRVAKRLLRPEDMVVTIVGNKEVEAKPRPEKGDDWK